MSNIRSRADILSLVTTNLPSGTGNITAANHRSVVESVARSSVALGEAETRVTSMALTAPPASPSDRDAYVVAASATGDWAGQDDAIAVYDANASPAGWFFITPADGAAVWNIADDTQYRWDDGASPAAWTAQGASAATESLIIAVGDETTALTAGTGKVTFRMPYAFTLSGVRASLTTASSVGTVTVDINESGATILSTKLTIDSGEKTSTTAAAAAVISDTGLADDAEITIDIDDAGDGGGSPTSEAAGLKVTLIGTRA